MERDHVSVDQILIEGDAKVTVRRNAVDVELNRIILSVFDVKSGPTIVRGLHILSTGYSSQEQG